MPDNWLWEPAGTRYSEAGSRLVLAPGKTHQIAVPEAMQSGFLQLQAQASSVLADLNLSIVTEQGFTLPLLPLPILSDRRQLAPLLAGQTHWLVHNRGRDEVTLAASIVRAYPKPEDTFYEVDFTGANKQANWYAGHHDPDHTRFVALDSDETLRWELDEAADWQLEVRTLVSNRLGTATPEQKLTLPLLWNNKPWQDWLLHPISDHRDYLEHAQCRLLTSLPMRAQIRTPAGNNILELRAPVPMLVRMIRQQKKSAEGGSKDKWPKATVGDQSLPDWLPDYDEGLLARMANALPLGAPLPNEADSWWRSERERKAVSIVRQRYTYWREHPVQSQIPLVSRMLHGKTLRLWDHEQFYARPGDLTANSTRRFFAVPAGASLRLPSAMSNLGSQELRLSVPGMSAAQQWTLNLAGGKQHTLQWDKPDNDKYLVMPAMPMRLFATARLSLTADDFPLSFRNAGRETQWLAVEYREAKKQRIEDAEWLSHLSVIGADRLLSLPFDDAPPADATEQRLWFEWEPLILWMRAARQAWSASLTDSADFEVDDETVKSWIQSLSAQGDYGLLTHLLKGVITHEKASMAWQRAYNWLDKYYREHQLDDARDSLYAMAAYRVMSQDSGFTRAARHSHLSHLAGQALQNNLPRMAARLYRALGEKIDSLAYLVAALQSGMLAESDSFSLSADLRKSLFSNSPLADAQIFQRLAQSAIDKSQSLSGLVEGVPESSHAGRLMEWLQTQLSTHPQMPILPLALSPGITYGTATIKQVERELYFERQRLAAGKYLEYQVVGPVTVELDARLLHGESDEVLNDWVRIENLSVGSVYYRPVIDSNVSQSLRIENDARGVGGSSKSRINLGPGTHRLRISLSRFDALIRLNALVPGLYREFAKQRLLNIQETEAERALRQSDVSEHGQTVRPKWLAHCEWTKNTEQEHLPAPKIPPAERWSVERGLSKSFTEQAVIQGMAPFEDRVLHALWWQSEWPREQRMATLAQIKQESLANQTDPELRRWLANLSRGFSWELASPVESYGQTRRIGAPDYGSPYMASREPLLVPSVPEGMKRLRGYQSLAFFTRFARPTSLTLDFSVVSLPYRPVPPINLAVYLDDSLYQTFSLDRQTRSHRLQLPAGEHRLRLALLMPNSDQWVYVAAAVNQQGSLQSLIEPSTRFYDVALRGEPLRFELETASLLRVDELHGDRVSYRYHYAPPGEFILKASSARSLYRVYRWREDDAAMPLDPYDFAAEKRLFMHKEASIEGRSMQRKPLASPVVLHENPQLGGVARATQGVYIAWQQQFEEDSADSTEEEQYLEAGWRYRKKRECAGCYTRMDLFARQHTSASHSLVGGKVWLDGRINDAWDWTMYQLGLSQMADDFAAAWYGSMTLKSAHAIDETQGHRHEAAIFGRYLSAEPGDETYDKDVFSSYKYRHRFGVRLAEQYHWHYLPDYRVQARIALTSNENLTPDQFLTRLSWQRYWQGLQARLAVQHQYFFNDQDRSSSSDLLRLGASLDYRWVEARGRIWSMRMAADYNAEQGDWNVGLSLAWDHNKGRGMRDYRPADEVFYQSKSNDVRMRTFHHSLQHDETH